MTTEETLEELGSHNWDESEAPMMFTSSAGSHEYDVLLEGTPAAQHLNTVGGASNITQTVHLKDTALPPTPLVEHLVTQASIVADCPLIHALHRVNDRGERFNVSAVWIPCWSQPDHRHTARALGVLILSVMFDTRMLLAVLACVTGCALWHWHSRAAALAFGAAFEQLHNGACAYLTQLEVGVSYWEKMRETHISRGKAERLRKSIRSTSELSLAGINQLHTRIIAEKPSSCDSSARNQQAEPHQLLYSLLMALTALLLDDSAAVLNDRSIRIELRALGLHLQAAAHALKLAVAERGDSSVSSTCEESCEAWEGFSELVSLLGAQVQALPRGAMPEENSIATLAVTTQSLQRQWLRVHDAATGALCGSDANGTHAEGEAWASECLADHSSTVATKVDEPLLECEDPDLSAADMGSPDDLVVQLSRAEFDGRRLRVAAEMEAKFGPEPTTASVVERQQFEDIFFEAVSYTHLRAHETVLDLVCRLLLEKKKKKTQK
eukprot:TRINITY_DN16995_c0_g1_i2.p1 TRINITY_DN16995_c0_g1~~TRINITY_DN16995_c0_g1_i2.p1  ORF type:complete len:496 (-),score=94.82 TRINITY_DN16995_c0_g1_i2:35-1522(-)